MTDLSFDVTADSDAESTFLADAAAAREFGRELDRLDGRNVRVRVSLDTPSQAPIQTFNRELDKVDRRIAKARVEIAGAEQAERASAKVTVALDAVPDVKRARIEVDLDKTAVDRITAITTGITRLGTVTKQVAGGVSAFRQAAGYIVDPGSIPIIQNVSNAIANKFHAAVELARVGVDKLQAGIKGLDAGILGLAAIGNVATIVVGVGKAIADLSGIALLAPAAIGAVSVAYGVAKLATTGFTDALTGSAKKQAEAFAAMGPEAQKLVTTLKSLGPAANEFRKAIQDTAVDGLSEQVKGLASTYLPMLKTGLSSVAAGMNDVAVNAARAVQSQSAIDGVRKVVDATAAATSRLKTSAADAIVGFINLAAAGTTSIPGIGNLIDDAARKFRVWTMVITETGQFDAWVNRAKTGFQQLGTFLGNVGSIAATVFRTLDQSGAGLLQTLARASTQMRTFIESTQGSSALTALAQTAAAAGQALSAVLGVALRAVAPILVSLGPVVSAVATAFSEHLIKVINLVSPALQRFAAELAKHPDLIADLAVKLHTAVVVFGPFVAALGLAAAVLQKMIIARVAAAALAALGLAGTTAGAALMFLVSPLSALGQLMPTIAAALGRWGASLAALAGPIGFLIVGVAALYASSSQFRDAMNQIGATLAQIFGKVLSDAGSVIASTVSVVSSAAAAIGTALSGIGTATTATMSIFGPFGDVVSTVLSTVFDWLGKLPGAALAAFAAFVLLGKIGPIFTTASAAVAGFAARMTAYSASTALGAAASNTAGAAAGKLATAIGKAGSALPVLGVALIAVGYAMDAIKVDFSNMIQQLSAGTISIQQFTAQAREAGTSGLPGFANQLTAWREGMTQGEVATLEAVHQIAAYRQSLGEMQKLEFDVATSKAALNDAVIKFGAGSTQAAAASDALAAANGKLSTAQKAAADAAKTHEQRVKELADTMRSQIGAMLDYSDAVRRTADAHKEAGDALKENGKASAEYAKATDDIIRSADSQAQAAAAQAKAWGAADDGISAYNTELLRAFDLSTTQGKDAFVKMASGLDDAGRSALSAAARTSGLRTEIISLPGGKKIEVVVAADQGKLPEVKTQLNDIAGKKWVGTVEIISETTNLRGDIDQIVRLVDGTTARIHVDAETGQAILTVNNTKYEIDRTTGALKVIGDVAQGEADLTGFKAKIDQTTGKVTAILDPTSANAGVAELKSKIDGILGIAKADLDSTPAGAKADQMKAYIDGITAILKADADIAPGTAKGTELQNHISGLIAIMTADADYAPGKAKGDELRAYITSLIGIMEAQANTDPATQAGRDAKATIDSLKALIQISGNADSAVQAARNAIAAIGGLPAAVIRITQIVEKAAAARSGGGIVGYSGGGIAGPRIHRAARGMVLPGYAPGRDTELSILSKGEAVLVPELVRQLGGGRILAANAEASGGRASTNTGNVASLMDGLIGATQRPVIQARITAAAGPRGAGASTVVMPPDLGPLLAATQKQTARLDGLEAAIRTQRPINVYPQPGNEVEAARAVQLANR